MTFPNAIGSDQRRDIAVMTGIRRYISRRRRPAMLFVNEEHHNTQYRATRHDPTMQGDLPDKHRLGIARGALVFAAMSIFLGACADSPTAPSDSFWHASASVSSAAPSDAVRITRAIAYAMRDASIRKAVQTAMRSSLVNEHKLVLQDYLKTQKGAKLFSATAAALDVTPQTLNDLLANLPNLDFYLPFKAHRLAWKPTSDVYVATTFDPDAATLTAYGTNGQTILTRVRSLLGYRNVGFTAGR
ncbi:MAG TPA: hypothetical protein VES88_12330 [Gemmatimonadaceae bacterium]|nr:hypothetical protein [Gemmatimonadaceae bacterium]